PLDDARICDCNSLTLFDLAGLFSQLMVKARITYQRVASNFPTAKELGTALREAMADARKTDRIVYLNADVLRVPDDEAVAHALFEVAMRREAVPRHGEALCALINKYTARREPL